MEIRLSETAKKDIQYFLKTGQKSILKKLKIYCMKLERHLMKGLAGLNH